MIKSGTCRTLVFVLVFLSGRVPLSAADLRVATENGVTTVVYNGRKVFSGSTSGTVSSKSAASNGVELAAVYDDDRVIWENVAGAGRYLQEAEKRRQGGATEALPASAARSAWPPHVVGLDWPHHARVRLLVRGRGAARGGA